MQHINKVTLEITNKCNLRCRMCSIWKEKPLYLGYEQIKQLLLSPKLDYPYVSITGGECFLHPEMDKIFNLLKVLLLRKRISGISISTNGFATPTIMKFLQRNEKYLPHISISISIDGMAKNHEYQRRVKDAFQNSMKTIKQIKERFPQLGDLAVKMTINRYNMKDVRPLYELCRDLDVKFMPKILDKGNPNYYHRLPIEKEFTGLLPEDYEQVIDLFVDLALDGGSAVDRDYFRKMIAFMKGNVNGGCSTPKYSLFVTCDGNLYPCIYMDPIANVNEPNWEQAIFGAKQEELIQIGQKLECPTCVAYHGYLREFNLD